MTSTYLRKGLTSHSLSTPKALFLSRGQWSDPTAPSNLSLTEPKHLIRIGLLYNTLQWSTKCCALNTFHGVVFLYFSSIILAILQFPQRLIFAWKTALSLFYVCKRKSETIRPCRPQNKKGKKCFKKTLKNMFADEHWQNKQFPVGKPIIFLTSVKNYYWHRHQILLRLLDEWKNVELSDFNNQTIKCSMLKITWKKM